MRGARRAHVPVLWPSWLDPQRVALVGAVLLFVDASLFPLLTPSGLPLAAAALPRLLEREALRSLAFMVVPAVSLGLLCARAAMRARSAVRVAVGCLGAGIVFGVLTFAGGYWMLMSVTPKAAGGPPDELILTILPAQVLAFTLSLLGLALPVSRGQRASSCDAVHEVLVVTGAWLLMAGTLVFWNGFGLSLAAHARVAPTGWSLLLCPMGMTMLVTGIAADVRLLSWLAGVRRDERPGWRIEPLAGRDVEVPALLGGGDAEKLDGVLVLDREAGALPVARVLLERSDGRRLLGARLRAAAVAVVLLLAVLLVVLVSLLHTRG